MDVQAIIMAGGEGMRLRPLTAYIPKPLVPLLGEPVMGYSLKLLKSFGVTDVGATLWYRPKEIRDAFGDGGAYGVRLKYYEERVPMGTAGSVKMARGHLKGTFIVLSGDGLTDCDLKQAVAFHREKQALATLVLRRVHTPLPYGVVMCDGEGRVTRFIEKPAWSRVFSDLVNTGIYILEKEVFDHIPDAGAPDFGKDIFPALVQGGLPVYGFETPAYWCDVGDLPAYLTAQRALLQGETAFPVAAGMDPLAQADPTARLEGECRIGKGTVIGPGALIRDAVIGENCTVAAGAVIEHSCLWDRASVGEKARIRGSVLCGGAAARPGAEMENGCVLGEGAVAGAHARLLSGVKVWPHLKALPGAVLRRSLVSGDSTAPRWTEDGACCDTPEEACALADAWVDALRPRQALVGGEEALSELVSGALAARGVQVLLAGKAAPPILRMLVRAFRAEGGVCCGAAQLRFLTGEGENLSASQRASLEAKMLRPAGEIAFARNGRLIRVSGAEEIYFSRVLPDWDKPLFSPVAVICPDADLLKTAARGLEKMRARDARFLTENQPLRPGETGFLLSGSGERAVLFTEAWPPDETRTEMLLLKILQERSGKLFDLPGIPRAAEALAPLLPADGSEACFRQRAVLEDGLAALFLLCGALKEGPADQWLRALPETHRLTLEAECLPSDKGRILHALCSATKLPHTLGEGVRFRHDRGYATIVPDNSRNAVRVTGESRDSEFARELCDFYLDQIKRITNTP